MAAHEVMWRRATNSRLGAAAKHVFALGGGNALLAHSVITRPTHHALPVSRERSYLPAHTGHPRTGLTDQQNARQRAQVTPRPSRWPHQATSIRSD
jgi:hypothetical protein